ncbi:MAG: hypothetical protein R6U32_03625 [Candidatus Woesearchaeota archaeon]
MYSKRGEVNMTMFVGVVVVLFLAGVLIYMIVMGIKEPTEKTVGPITENIEGQSEHIGKVGGEADYDRDGVPDSVDMCCDCTRIGPEGVAKSGERPGCAPGQKEGVCLQPCSSGTGIA